MERSSLRFDEAKGPKLLPRFVVYIALAAGLMVADYRFSLMQPVRAAVMPMLYPAQWLANQPVQLYQYFADLSQSKSELLEQNRRLLEENGRLKIDLQRDKVNTDELRELKNCTVCNKKASTMLSARKSFPMAKIRFPKD